MDRLDRKAGGADRRRRGFTLIEVTVAIGLLGLIMLGLAAMAGISTRGGAMSKQRIRATHLASQMLETLSAAIIADTDIPDFNGDDTSNSATYPVGGDTDLWGQAIRAQLGNGANGTIVVENNQPTTNNFRITVTVNWPFQGVNRQVQMVGVR